jgi:hypothetical protein
MTTTELPTASLDREFRLAAVDLYRDIHKGIRAELFAVTTTAGSIDPTSAGDRAALADHVASIQRVLESHAHHEDAVIDPVLAEHEAALAEAIAADHDRLESHFARLAGAAVELVHAPYDDSRRLGHRLYLELAKFTSDYLAHQDCEERVVMPALERAIGPAGCGALHGAIVGSIPPDELARSLAFMLPAMNVDDRVEMLSGIRLAAPTEAFEAVVGLSRSVLTPVDAAALSARLMLS